MIGCVVFHDNIKLGLASHTCSQFIELALENKRVVHSQSASVVSTGGMEASLGRNRDNPDAKAPVYEGTEIIQMPKLQLRKEPR
ncbi:hypothetical protein V6N13_104807 [Hibiscus sabdariffa]|uniref:Uncharacterized protein n=2 Tax=Hibiscus sabdariffa TaxID=183260 RepID=A0ABR2SIH3_9ROSI